MTVRRTKLKGAYKAATYSLDKDYAIHEYHISEIIATEIERYVAATQNIYNGKIDTLFCKKSQFQCFSVNMSSDGHYTRSNLDQCLNRFYNDILIDHYGLTVVADRCHLDPDEIELLNLGDTRHISLISLVLSKASLTICSELAGHADINTTAHYYSNLTTFLDAMAYEQYIPSQKKKSTIIPSERMIFTQPVQGGYCQSPQVAHGDFSDCSKAVDCHGQFGQCALCCFFIPTRNTLLSFQKEETNNLKATYALLCRCLEQLRTEAGCTESLENILERLRTQAERYCKYTTLRFQTNDKGRVIDVKES